MPENLFDFSDDLDNSQLMVVIFKNLSSNFTITPRLVDDIFNLENIPYLTPHSPVTQTNLTDLYKEKLLEASGSARSVILINYNPVLVQLFADLLEPDSDIDISEWIFLTFFHEDEQIKNNLLEIKANEILDMSKYSFIKKFYVPYGFEITFEYLKEVFEEIF